jgi:hypothetical protein
MSRPPKPIKPAASAASGPGGRVVLRTEELAVLIEQTVASAPRRA